MRTFLIIGSIILVFVIGFSLYKMYLKKPVLTIYVENRSFDLTEVDLMVLVDEKVLADERFKTGRLAPNFRIFEMEIDKGIHVIRISSKSQNLSEVDTVEIANDLQVFVGFEYRLKSKFQYEQEKFKFEALFPRDKSPDKKFEFDSVAIAPTIKVHVTNEKPVLE